jgi:hypothetical protein
MKIYATALWSRTANIIRPRREVPWVVGLVSLQYIKQPMTLVQQSSLCGHDHKYPCEQNSKTTGGEYSAVCWMEKPKLGRTPACVKTCNSQDKMTATWHKERSTVETNEIMKTAAHRSESWCWRQFHVQRDSACSFSVRQDSDISTQGTAPVYVIDMTTSCHQLEKMW